MHKYDLTIVIDGETTAAKKKSLSELVQKEVKELGGELFTPNEWGKRNLAYSLGKASTGIYISFPLKLETSAIAYLNNKLRVNEKILRYLLIREGN